MKQFFLLLLLSPLFIACSDDDKDDNNGYLTSLERVKIGIVGVWEPSNAIYYYGFNSQGNKCSGFAPDKLTEGCGKYEIIQNDGNYILRIFGIDDLDGSGSYVDYVVVTLNNKELVYKSASDVRAYFTRVK